MIRYVKNITVNNPLSLCTQQNNASEMIQFNDINKPFFIILK